MGAFISVAFDETLETYNPNPDEWTFELREWWNLILSSHNNRNVAEVRIFSDAGKGQQQKISTILLRWATSENNCIAVAVLTARAGNSSVLQEVGPLQWFGVLGHQLRSLLHNIVPHDRVEKFVSVRAAVHHDVPIVDQHRDMRADCWGKLSQNWNLAVFQVYLVDVIWELDFFKLVSLL